MLKENKELNPRSRYREAEDFFKDDERFLAVTERRDREEIFDEYIHDWAKEVNEHIDPSSFAACLECVS